MPIKRKVLRLRFATDNPGYGNHAAANQLRGNALVLIWQVPCSSFCTATVILDLITETLRWSELEKHNPEKLHEGASSSGYLVVSRVIERLWQRQLSSGC